MNRERRDTLVERRGKIPVQGDHRGWIDWWFAEVDWAMRDYQATGQPLSLLHVKRAARQLHWHALRLRPALRP